MSYLSESLSLQISRFQLFTKLFIDRAMCLGDPIEPPTQKAAQLVFKLQIINAVQVVIIILNFVTLISNNEKNHFITQGIFGLILVFLLFHAWRQLSYRALLFFTFISMYFAVVFLVYVFTYVQRGTNFNKMKQTLQYVFIDACISFAYYIFASIFMFFPYREFKSIQYSMDPTFNQFLNLQNQQPAQAQRSQPSNLDYGQNVQQQPAQQQATFEIFKGKGVRIG